MRRLGRVVVVVMALSWSSLAQTPNSAVLLPVPGYPPDGRIPDALKDQFVFLDTQTFDLVLAYPPAGPLGRGEGASARTIRRLELPRHVLPAITASVTKTQAGTYQYTYSVRNGTGARQAIRRWYLSVPAPEAPNPLAANPAAAAMSQDDGWTGGYYSFRPGEWAVRWESDTKRRLSPGPTKSFVITDKNGPGIVLAYFQGDVPTAGLPADLPQAALTQLAAVQRLEFSSAAVLTIGPKFDARTSKLIIAGDFHLALSRLVRGGALDEDSPFVKGALSQLREYLERPRAEGTDLRSLEPFPPLSQKPRAASPLENQLYSAMRVALDFQ